MRLLPDSCWQRTRSLSMISLCCSLTYLYEYRDFNIPKTSSDASESVAGFVGGRDMNLEILLMSCRQLSSRLELCQQSDPPHQNDLRRPLQCIFSHLETTDTRQFEDCNLTRYFRKSRSMVALRSRRRDGGSVALSGRRL
jgi:hypothetical protein